MNITPVQGSGQWTVPKKSPAADQAAAEQTTRMNRDTLELGNAANTDRLTYAPPKKLDSSAIRDMEEQQSRQKMELLRAMANESINQANHWLKGKGEALGVDMSRFALPPLALDPEGAQAAIAPGGAYSVDAVATRIFDMACLLAGDDAGKLEEMRAAVIKGFEAAGADFSGVTGQGLPEICNDTYKEIMDRFDKKMEELAGAAPAETEK